MRLAVFTNHFPARLNTLFARDMRALIAAGIELDVYPFYPLDDACWPMVPALLGPEFLPRDRVRHLERTDIARSVASWPSPPAPAFLRDAARVVRAGMRFGVAPAAKAAYAAGYAWATAKRFAGPAYDHVLAYWGNYAASAAYLFHRHVQPDVPFSMFVHARMDLYRQPAFLTEKLLYADNVFVVCEYNRRYLEQHYSTIYPRIAARIQLHHLGLPLEEIRYEPEPRPPARLIGVGNLEPLKGFAGAVQAVAALRARGMDVELELLGRGEAEPELRRLAGRLGVSSAVIFRGWVAPDEVLAAMRTATLLVHPSVAPDAMPTVIKEAMAVGTPVVASDLAGIPEMLDGGRCGRLVPPGDAAALTVAIAELLDAPLRRRELADAARAHLDARFNLWTNGAALAATLRRTERQRRAS
jgi:colanic acid/amylovoran biosynthesis glycosyltransferase